MRYTVTFSQPCTEYLDIVVEAATPEMAQEKAEGVLADEGSASFPSNYKYPSGLEFCQTEETPDAPLTEVATDC